jgi:uncharacterized SAM-binding protein YcdF (DUF218 family)
VKRLLARAFDFLADADAPGPADAIFVFAGRPERKRHGLALWRRGLAPVLILSVARFEWRRFPELGLEDDGGLRALVEATYYKRRHFFVTLDPSGTRVRFVPPRALGTRREAFALAEEAGAAAFRSILVVTSPPHVRRARFAVERALRGSGVRIACTAAPGEDPSMNRESWWRSGSGRSYVAAEFLKLGLYRLLPR